MSGNKVQNALYKSIESSTARSMREALISNPDTGLFVIKPQIDSYKKITISRIAIQAMRNSGIECIYIDNVLMKPEDVKALNQNIFNAETIDENNDENSFKFREELVEYMTSSESTILIFNGHNAKNECLANKLPLRNLLSNNITNDYEARLIYSKFICNYLHAPEIHEYKENAERLIKDE